MSVKNPGFSGSMKHIYAELAIDGRTKRGKRLAGRWRTLFPRIQGDSVREGLFLRLLKFESDNASMSGHDLGILMQMYNRLGFLLGDGQQDTPSNALSDYLEKKL